ncbi:caspase family protein [Desmonostoc muscorum LEGE 12446]|uniref:Caspase family protein n=1 Tax=Desmonostoc muscorum LEGE 12446 TaxID=1828758 RepID=A0A8J7A8Y0_DESMC|nr:caspase family protein [Desmonostoc muscorum]MCF2151472.1 caspase family protein [Desmonostoc muscorum LEGE 12446]
MNRDALVVGINQYPFLKDTPTSKAKHLFTPANDAEAIAQRLEEYGDFRVRRLPETIQGEQRRVTSDGLVKHETLEDAIIQLFNPVGENIPETALLYFIGHGLRKNRGGVTEGFLAASDVDPRKNLWGISVRWLRELLQKSPVKQQIVWLDCCYSGELFNFVEADLGTSLQEQTRFLIAASREFEFAEEDIQGKHGVFSKALWQGLDPRQQPDGLVNNDKLIEYIAQTLKDVPQQPIWYNPNREIMLTGEREDVLIHIPNGVCPYKGLRFFDVEDATYFYGREVLTQKLIQHVQVGKGNFLAVLGVSGSGKSSLLRAGLIYQLQQQRRLPGTEEWKIRIFSPGEQPLVSLATAFLDESATDMQRAEQLKVADEAIAQGATGLARLIRAARSPRTLLIVDQFEEIFTVCQSHSDRQQFISSLLGALKQTGDKLCLIFAMRDDFLGKCAAYHELTDLIQTNLVMVTPMSLEELQQAIREPAAKLGRKVEENLINAILKDLGVEVGQPTQEPEPGMLPLLSYTLEQLWQRQKLNWLKLDSYHQLGGVRKTLENLAEKTYKKLSAEEQRVTDLIFINLTQLGEGTPDTRKQVPQRDLISLDKSERLVERVIQKLALAKLIVTSEQRRGEEKVAVVDVSHEALIRHWSRLRELLDNNREAIRTERKIQAAAEEWQDKEKYQDYLLTGLRLAETEKFLHNEVDTVPLSNLAKEFIQNSQEYQIQQEQRWKKLYEEAEEQRKIALARQLAAQSELLRNQQPRLLERSVLLAVESVKRYHSVETDQALRQGLSLLARPLVNLKNEYKNMATAISFSLDSNLLAIHQEEDTVQLWHWNSDIILKSLKHRKKISPPPNSHNYKFSISSSFFIGHDYLVTISDESFINNAYQYDYHTIWVWELLTGQAISSETLRTRIIDIDFCASRNYIVAVLPLSYFEPQVNAIVHKSQVIFWQLINRKLTPIRKLISESEISAVALHPNLECLALSYKNKVIFVMWDSDQEFKSIEQEEVSIVVFSPDGSYLATAVNDLSNQKYTVSVWDIISTKEIIRIPHKDILYSLAFSPDGKYLATTGRSTITHIWQIDSGQESARINHDSFVHKIVFSPVYNGGYLLAGSSAQIWKLDGMPEIASIDYKTKNVKSINDDIMCGAVFSPDCKHLAIIDENNTVQIWNIINGKEFVSHLSYDLPVKLFCFSPDGEYIATVSKDNTLCLKKWKDCTSEPLILIKGKDSGKLIRSFIFSLDGNYLAIAIETANNRKWEIRVLSIEDKMTHSQTNQNNASQVWEVLSQEESKYITYEETEVTIVKQNNDIPIKVNDVNLSCDGENLYLAIAKSDGTAIIWNVVDGNKIIQIAHKSID